MKPAKFTYHAPATLEETFELLERYEDEAKIIAGGQSLIPIMNLRLAQPEHVIDINGISELTGIELQHGRLAIGALTRHSELLESELVRTRCPLLARAASFIGHIAIRNRGTIGGSLVNADPAAEWSLMAILLDAELTIRSPRGERVVRGRDFIQSVYTVDLEFDEILTGVSFPCLEAAEGWSLQQISRRAGDFAIVAVAATVRLDEAGDIDTLRLAVGGMDATPLRLEEIEQGVVGRKPDGGWRSDVSSAAAGCGSPESDMHASADYRRDVCAVLTDRALTEALAGTGEED